MDTNLVIISGRLTRDPSLRFIPSGTAVAESAIAVNHYFKKKNGDEVKDVTFINIELWAQSAERFTETMVKGDRILVKGELRQEKWEKDGQKRETFKVKVSEFAKLEGGNSNGYTNSTKAYSPPEPAADDSDLDEIPF